MLPGVSEEDVALLKEVLRPYGVDYDFFAYGSRVRGKFSRNSDLDLMVKGGEPIPSEVLAEIRERFDASDLPFLVHINDFYALIPSFYEEIQKDLQKIPL